MHILHLNTHSYGGAAKVARRLHEAALADGVASSLVTKFGLRTDPTPGYTALRPAGVIYALRQSAANRYLYNFGKFVQRQLEPRQIANRPGGYDIFSPLNTRPAFADCAHQFSPDVIHLHWIAGFLDHPEFFRAQRDRRFVWTLHDMNPFTGGCHYAFGCLGFTGDCTGCPQLEGTRDADYASVVLESKMNALRELADEQLTIVAPSQWMLSLSNQSRATGRFRHVHIPNPSFNGTPVPESSRAVRAELGLPLDKKIVLFVSDNLRNVRKGVGLLFNALRLMRNANDIHLVGVGQRTDRPGGISVTFPGTITDERVLARYLSAADLLVSPSSAENSPLVIIEALTCGTPVVAFDVGGIPELLDEHSGLLVRTRTASALAAALEDALFSRAYNRGLIRERARRHAPEVVWQQYRRLYSQMLATRAN